VAGASSPEASRAGGRSSMTVEHRGSRPLALRLHRQGAREGGWASHLAEHLHLVVEDGCNHLEQGGDGKDAEHVPARGRPAERCGEPAALAGGGGGVCVCGGGVAAHGWRMRRRSPSKRPGWTFLAEEGALQAAGGAR